MSSRYPNHRLVKIHRTYTVEEVAARLGVHRNTVRQWLRDGLATIDKARPLLIAGDVLIAFSKSRRAARKRPCRPGQIYCLRCRAPREPVGGQAMYQPLNVSGGNLVGICQHCGSQLFRRVSLAGLASAAGNLQVTMPEALEHIDESHQPSLNSDFRQDAADHD